MNLLVRENISSDDELSSDGHAPVVHLTKWTSGSTLLRFARVVFLPILL